MQLKFEFKSYGVSNRAQCILIAGPQMFGEMRLQGREGGDRQVRESLVSGMPRAYIRCSLTYYITNAATTTTFRSALDFVSHLSALAIASHAMMKRPASGVVGRELPTCSTAVEARKRKAEHSYR